MTTKTTYTKDSDGDITEIHKTDTETGVTKVYAPLESSDPITEVGDALLGIDRHKLIRTENDTDSGSSCCFITSACLKSMNLPMDSLEMKAMQDLAKNYVLKSFKGMREYVKYHKNAPGIVTAINSRADSSNIWSNVYANLQGIAKTIMSGDYQTGQSQYKDLVNRLENEFV
jgi:hypothetical protein